jgi:fermentation-respiration switch protein FrsA (DUF1100 family)
MTTPHPRWTAALRKSVPPLALAGVLGGLEYLRRRFERSQLFMPDRYPNGVWEPGSHGLLAEDVWFRAEDGVDLHGWWLPHPRATGTVLYCHGNSGSIGQQIGVLRHMRRLRVNVFAFDYRGYGRSTGQPTEQGLYRDARAAFDHLIGPLGQRPGGIVVFGHSLGGAVAIDCAGTRPVAGLIAQSTFTHIRDAARASFPSLPIHLLAGRRRFHSLSKVGHLTMPKLFVHGDADGTLPLSLAERLYAEAAEPKELYVVRGAGHNDVYRHGGLRYLRRLSGFGRCCFRAGAERSSVA